MKARRPTVYADEKSLRMILGDEAGKSRKRPAAKPLNIGVLLVLALITFMVAVTYLAFESNKGAALSAQSSDQEALICIPRETGLDCF